MRSDVGDGANQRFVMDSRLTANSGRSQGRIGFRKADACTAQSCGQVTNPPLPCLQSHLR